jgi:hypothetical protein
LQEQRHRQQLIEQQKYNEELRKNNERLAELESKLNEIWRS